MKRIKLIIAALIVACIFTTSSFADVKAKVENVTANIDNVSATSKSGISKSTIGDVKNTTNTIVGVKTGDFTQTFEAGDRPFPIQGDAYTANMPGYFGDNNKPGHQFIPLAKLLMYNTSWKVRDEAPIGMGKKVNLTIHTDKVAKEDRSTSIICTKEVFDTTKVDLKLLAIGTINSSNKNIISSDLLEKVLYEAAAYGATHVQFLAEGTNTELQASGWGIGFSYTKANDSSVSTGGTGFSTGWAGYQNLPWQQFMFLKISDPEAVGQESDPAPEKVVENTLDPQVEKAIQDKVVN